LCYPEAPFHIVILGLLFNDVQKTYFPCLVPSDLGIVLHRSDTPSLGAALSSSSWVTIAADRNPGKTASIPLRNSARPKAEPRAWRKTAEIDARHFLARTRMKACVGYRGGGCQPASCDCWRSWRTRRPAERRQHNHPGISPLDRFGAAILVSEPKWLL